LFVTRPVRVRHEPRQACGAYFETKLDRKQKVLQRER
jgi:hypothetical protein